MSRIWIKTKYDPGMQMDIPHSINIANAMYGFLELGAEVTTYHSLDDVFDRISREDIVIDYLQQCNEVFHKFGVIPKIPDYPDALRVFLGRKVWRDTIDSISCNEKKWSAGYFVKPIKDKRFTGRIVNSISDLAGCGSCYENYEVLVSEPLEILAEWRAFILYDELLDVRPYGILLDNTRKSYEHHYDISTVRQMLTSFCGWDERPTACSMDICFTRDGRTLLVEMNDAYALGCYGLPSVLYAKLISARWSQLLERADEYKF